MMAGAALQTLRRIVDPNEREIARHRRRVEQINALEPEFERLTNEQLAQKTEEFKRRLADGETVDDILDEAFAAAREAARRTIGQRHFDVQIVGAIVLHQGKIAEMKTGEGKTLTATMPLYLHALTGRGVHLVTTNDYLVKWQSEWMGEIFRLLGLTCGYIQHDMDAPERKEMYACDITYVENSELASTTCAITWPCTPTISCCAICTMPSSMRLTASWWMRHARRSSSPACRSNPPNCTKPSMPW